MFNFLSTALPMFQTTLRFYVFTMDNYNKLLQWLVHAELEVTSLEDKQICSARLASKRFGGMEYAMVFAIDDDDMLIFDLTVDTPPVDEYNRDAVAPFFQQLNAQPDAHFEWWINADGDVNLLYALHFEEAAAVDDHLPLFYVLIDGMIVEADTHYLDLVNAIVEPTRKGIGQVVNMFQQRFTDDGR